jgi:hypothetical protein
MDLNPFIDRLRRELAVAAKAGGEDARTLAERLTAPLESAARLALLEALSAAADEITRDLAPGSVDVRLRGREPSFVVTPPPASQPFEGDLGEALAARGAASATAGEAPAPPLDADEGGMSRVSLRLPEHLKQRVDQAAGREGLSVNAWLVRAVSAALDADARGRGTRQRDRPQVGRHYTGWVR